ncbi:hypothetical protein FRB96_007748 [Tulasnella sp. 330]|nr:hypothetical protein FRB96_007748 [Tulasnella sp. 330]KAG8881696.1 hypothetical protein FRB97_009245 [Tulasnella sp. 331]KAG8887763.1 hypothetical protein FRB98_009085 [Tulasnella sp. 332]
MSGVFGWTTLNATLLEKIKDRMIEGATESWKAGTCAETLTEVYYPKVSVFNPEYLTSKSFSTYSAADLTPVLSIAKFAVESRSSKGMLWGPTGAAGDAGSLGVSVVLANHTQGAPVEPWAAAAETELELLLTGTPRLTFGHGAGAISHRPDLVSLWSDSVYMVPPFLAYYAAVTGNISLMREAHTQISLYRRVLYNQDASLWTHIYSPASSHYFNDTGFWCSGNGWAAAGMLRVLATMKNSPYSSQLIPEQNDLSNWITEIHTGMIKYLPFPSFNSSGGLFYNYVDQQVDSAISFPDASGTALFAASVYKHITLMNPPGYMVILAAAERARKTIYANDGEIHFDGDGWLRPVVNPDSFQMAGRNSDEAQSFVLQLDYNWKEWKQRGLR